MIYEDDQEWNGRKRFQSILTVFDGINLGKPKMSLVILFGYPAEIPATCLQNAMRFMTPFQLQSLCNTGCDGIVAMSVVVKDLERVDRGRFQGTVSALSWGEWSRKASIRTANDASHFYRRNCTHHQFAIHFNIWKLAAWTDASEAFSRLSRAVVNSSRKIQSYLLLTIPPSLRLAKNRINAGTIQGKTCFNFFIYTELYMDIYVCVCVRARARVCMYYVLRRIKHAWDNMQLHTQCWAKYECVSKSFRTGSLEQEPQMVQLSANRWSYIAILWVSVMRFAAITLCVASWRVFFVLSVYFVMTQSGNFWIHRRTSTITWKT
jgi:hypothetical protein